MRLPLFIDLEARKLVRGLNDPSTPELPELMQGDTVDVVLQFVEKNADAALLYYRTISIPYTTIKCAVTAGADVPPTGGTIRLGLVGGAVGDVTTPFAPTITKIALRDQLNTLPGVTAKGGIKALDTNGASNILRVRWNTAAETALFEFRENLLEPRSDVRSNVVPLPNGQVQLLKFRQLPLAFTDQFALPAAPAVSTAGVRTGTSARNCIQAIIVPRAATGAVHFTFAGRATAILPVASVNASALATVLNDLFDDALVRFVVSQATSTTFYVEFVGPLALLDSPVLEATMHDQTPLNTPTARLPLNGSTLEMAFDGAAKITRVLEIEITDAGGEVGTPIQMPVTLRNDVIDGGMSIAADPAWLTPTDPAYPPNGDGENAIVVPGAYIVPVGSGIATGTSGKDFIVTHNLGSSDVLVQVRETAGTRLRIPDDQYVTTILSDAQVEVVFAAAPTEGQYRIIIAAVQAAAMALPHHTHEIEDVEGLQDALDALVNGINPDGPISAQRLPALIPWYNYDAQGRATTLRFAAFLPDELLAGNIPRLVNGRLPAGVLPFGVPYVNEAGEVVIDLPGPPPRTVVLLNADGRFPWERFPANPADWPGFAKAVLDVLQGGATLPPGFVPMLIAAPLNESFPAAVVLRAGAVAQPASLARAIPAFLTGGGISDELPLPDASNANRVYVVAGGAGSAPVRWRARQTFAAGALVASDGQQWFEVRTEGGNAYPAEMERELFTLTVSSAMLSNARFACSGEMWLSLSGPCARTTRARYVLRIEHGATVGPLLNDVAWTTAFDLPLLVGTAATAHAFGFSVERTTAGVMTAKKSLYGTETVIPAPATADFLVRASLCCFDLEDVTGNTTGAAPVGQMVARLNNPRASVVRLPA